MNASQLYTALKTGTQIGSLDANAADFPTISTTLAGLATLTQGCGSHIKKTVLNFGANDADQKDWDKLLLSVTSSSSKGQATVPLFTFPKGVIRILKCVPNLVIASTAAWAPTTPVVGIGSAAVAAAASSLTTTTQDIIASTALTISGGASAFQTSWYNAISALTDSSGGTAGATLAAIAATATYLQADLTAIKNGLASLNAQINKIGAAQELGSAGYVFDGRTNALTPNLNFACNSDPSTGKSLQFTGNIEFVWEHLGTF